MMKYDDPDINELLNVCTYLDPRFKGPYIDEADVTLVEYHLTKASVDEDQDSTSEPAASTLPTFGDFTEASLSKKSGIKKHKLLIWLKKATEMPSSSSTSQTPEQQTKKEIKKL